MIMAIATRRSDLLIFKTAVSTIRAINTNMIIVSGNDYFLIFGVMVMMVMRRAANTNVVMVPSNYHFLIPIVVVVVVVVVVVG
jgi:hypothetical protein